MSAIRSTQTTVRSQRDTSTDRAQELRELHRNPPSFLGSRQQSWRATAHRPAAVQAPSPCRDASRAPVGSGPEAPGQSPVRDETHRPKPIGSHSVMPASPLRLGMPSAWGRSRAPTSAVSSPPRRRRARAWPQPRTELRPFRPRREPVRQVEQPVELRAAADLWGWLTHGRHSSSWVSPKPAQVLDVRPAGATSRADSAGEHPSLLCCLLEGG